MVRGVVLATSWLALSVGTARAEETYPTGVRTITATTATSTCIGDISTPICALETRLACLARRDPTLCRATETPSEGERADQTYCIVGYAILRDRGNASRYAPRSPSTTSAPTATCATTIPSSAATPLGSTAIPHPMGNGVKTSMSIRRLPRS